MATKKTTTAKTTAAKAVEETKKAAATTAKKVEEVKAEATKAVEETKATATKTVKKATATAKKTATKAAAKKAEAKVTSYVEFMGDQFDVEDITAKAVADFKANNARKALKDIKVYIKVEEKAAYYVANGDYPGRVEL